MADKIADALHLLLGKLRPVPHGHKNGGAGVILVFAVQNESIVLTRRDIHDGLLNPVKATNHRRNAILELIELQLLPFPFCGQAPHMIQIHGVGEAGLGVALLSQRRLEPYLLLCRHQNRVASLDPVIGHPLLGQIGHNFI